MLKFLLAILKDEFGATLAVTRKTANTLITASGFNTNYDQIEAVVNALTSTNYANDSVGAAALASDVIRATYGLIQHTDGSLYVDVSDTNPGLELSDGGLRVKAYGLAQRTSNGLDIGRSGDLLLSSASSVPTGWTDVSATYEGKFIRVSATALSTGGVDTHTHTGGSHTHTLAPGANVQIGATTHVVYMEGGILKVQDPGTVSTVTGNIAATAAGGTGATGSGDNVPVYLSSKLFKKD